MLEAAPLMSTLRFLAEATEALPPVAAPTTAPTHGLPPGWEVPILCAWLVVCLGVAAGVTASAHSLGAFRRGVADGPARIAPDRPVWPTVAAMFGGIFAYLGVSAAAAAVMLGLTPTLAGDPAGLLTTMQVSAAGYAGAIVVALALHAVARRRGMAGPLGLSLRRLPLSLVVGGAALLVVLPWTFATGVVVQFLRFLLHFPSDATHPVLQAMRDHPDRATILWGLLTSVVVAPVAEEIFFRGFLQTSLVYGLPRLFGIGNRGEGGGGGGGAGDDVTPAAFAAEESPSPPDELPDVSPRWRWVGIVLSATLFTLLHPPWSWPMILILGLAFGYVYERTGTLYAGIAMHFVFNAINVAILLLTL